jgi:hypothetical protein
MSDAQRPSQTTYQITIRGSLDSGWETWFDGITIVRGRLADGSWISVLTGRVVDQAALRGILCRLWDLNLTVVSVALLGDAAGDLT